MELFETRYCDFTAKHSWKKLVAEHDFKRSHNWVRLTLQAHDKIKKAPRREAHRRRRPPAPEVIMPPAWLPGSDTLRLSTGLASASAPH